MYRGAVLVVVLLCISAGVASPWPERGNFPVTERGNYPQLEQFPETERGDYPEPERNNFPAIKEYDYEKPYSTEEENRNNDGKILESDESNDVIAQWDNDWDGILNKVCSDCQALYRVKSKHDNYREDRLWEFQCRSYPKLSTKCWWSDYANDFDQPFLFSCGTNNLMTGVSSYHDNGREDRRWKFRCCSLSSAYSYNCHWTGYINTWDGWMDYCAWSGHAITGIYSYHDNYREDRLWKVEHCAVY